MKRILVIALTVLVGFLVMACDHTTTEEILFIDCQIGYMWDGDACVDDPNSIVVDYRLYLKYYEGEDYIVYRDTYRTETPTDNIVELGEYDGSIYYFESGTYYNFYRVVKNDEIKLLNEALALEWFALGAVVNDFEIEELLSQTVET